jgi:hypothetical protein
LHFVGEEEIAEFEVSMDNSIGVHILNCYKQLDQVRLDLKFGEPFSSSELLIHGLVGAEFEQDVDVVIIFKVVLE